MHFCADDEKCVAMAVEVIGRSRRGWLARHPEERAEGEGVGDAEAEGGPP